MRRLEEEAKEKQAEKEKMEEAKKKKEDEVKKVQELKKMEKKKDRGMNNILAMEKELDVEYDAAAKLVSERLSVALSKKDMDEVTIATALIDSANKKMDLVKKKKRESPSKKR